MMFIFASKITPHIPILEMFVIYATTVCDHWFTWTSAPLLHTLTVDSDLGFSLWLHSSVAFCDCEDKRYVIIPRKTEASCSIPPKPHAHCWVEETIAGLPSAWAGWNRASVGLEGFRGIRIIGGANFLCLRLPAEWRYCKLLLSAERVAL